MHVPQSILHNLPCRHALPLCCSRQSTSVNANASLVTAPHHIASMLPAITRSPLQPLRRSMAVPGQAQKSDAGGQVGHAPGQDGHYQHLQTSLCLYDHDPACSITQLTQLQAIRQSQLRPLWESAATPGRAQRSAAGGQAGHAPGHSGHC